MGQQKKNALFCSWSSPGNAFHFQDDKFWCQTHFAEKYIKQCAHCSKSIDGAYVKVLGSHFHAACFVCGNCDVSLQGQAFLKVDDTFVCQPCADLLQPKAKGTKPPTAVAAPVTPAAPTPAAPTTAAAAAPTLAAPTLAAPTTAAAAAAAASPPTSRPIPGAASTPTPAPTTAAVVTAVVTAAPGTVFYSLAELSGPGYTELPGIDQSKREVPFMHVYVCLLLCFH